MNSSISKPKRLGSLALIATFLCAAPFVSGNAAMARETTGEKMQNEADEARKDARQEARRAKRRVRNDTGRGTASKDIEDYSKDAGDEAETAGRKVKRKVD